MNHESGNLPKRLARLALPVKGGLHLIQFNWIIVDQNIRLSAKPGLFFNPRGCSFFTYPFENGLKLKARSRCFAGIIFFKMGFGLWALRWRCLILINKLPSGE